jgi:hypothetical protein
MMGMLFTGGDCSQSFNTQGSGFSCVDYQGGPPTEAGAEAWIQVTSYKGEGAEYHDDWVAVGDVYYLSDDDETFVTDQRISIYSSEDKTEESLLQVVQFSTACTSNLALNDRFGASQVVEWENAQQGSVASTVNVSFTIGLDIPASTGAGITIDSVTVVTDYGGEATDLTLELGGTFLPSGSILPVSVPATIDVTEDTSFSFRIEIIGTDSNGNTCVGSGSYTFSTGPTGTPAPSAATGVIPTLAPAPGTSSAPILPGIPTDTLPPGMSP